MAFGFFRDWRKAGTGSSSFQAPPPDDSTISAGNIVLRQVFTTAPSGHPADFKWVNRTDYVTANQPGSTEIPLNMPSR